jgi:hypothetical protein
MTDAEGEDAVGLHGVVVFGADEALEDVTMVADVAVLGDFQSGPKAEVAAADFTVGAAEDDVPAEGILFEEEMLKYSRSIFTTVELNGCNRYDSNQFRTGNQNSSGWSGMERPLISIIPLLPLKWIKGV